ncbi:MAG: bifunctional precorrin-2 dehydrogenase/sirohydrochlorin ferrochelatase [Treponema sp.]|nr:bifunctional precorrin-2 dehydrogenase/sirohydrochlorin ferrochelatase [Treponema sp.]
MAYFPLFVNLKSKEVLVLGGGETALQEASRFIAFEAVVTVLTEKPDQNLTLLRDAYPKNIRLVSKKLNMDTIIHLECRPLLVICTVNDNALNSEVYKYYSVRNVLVEDFSNSSRCDFIFPAIVKKGDVVCGISSSGKSPHVSQFVKSILESSLPENISDINEHMNEIRRTVKQSISDPAKRSAAMQAIFTRLLEDDNQTPDYEIDGIIAEAEL